jgi:predicted porin
MQKKLIAMAVAGLVSGAAFAQANVTIYGAADATYDSVTATGSTSGAGNYDRRGRTTMNSGILGFKGAESLGNGLTAVFQYETGVNETGGGTNTLTNTQSFMTRDTFVGLAGGFGTVAAGTLTGPARALGAAMDVNAGGTGIGMNNALLGKFGGGSGGGYFDTRFANTIAYISPTFGGASAVVAYVPNENRSVNNGNGSNVNTSAWTAGLNYNNGPIMAGYAWTRIKDTGNNGFGPLTTGVGPVTIDKTENNRLAGKFDFGMGTVGLMWDQSKANLHGTGISVKNSVWYLPVTFNLGGGKLIAQYGQAGNLSGVPNLDTKAKHVEVGYEYSLSKRTLLKALYSQITNNRDGSYDFLYGVSAPNTTAPGAGVAAGADPKGFSIGMRHTF